MPGKSGTFVAKLFQSSHLAPGCAGNLSGNRCTVCFETWQDAAADNYHTVAHLKENKLRLIRSCVCLTRVWKGHERNNVSMEPGNSQLLLLVTTIFQQKLLSFFSPLLWSMNSEVSSNKLQILLSFSVWIFHSKNDFQAFVRVINDIYKVINNRLIERLTNLPNKQTSKQTMNHYLPLSISWIAH